MSLIQGGLPIFLKHLYSCLVTGKHVNLEIKNDDVPDLAAQNLPQKVMHVITSLIQNLEIKSKQVV